MLVYPNTLSFDWGMDAIPRITTLFDARNILTLFFYSALCRIVMNCIQFLRRTMPKIINSKRLGRTIQKRKHQMHSPKSLDDVSIVQSNQLWDSENTCLVCKQGFKYRHTSSNGNAGYTATSICGVTQSTVNSNKKQVISLSPLKKYIRNNNSLYLNNVNNNNNNNDNEGGYMKDNNNNNLCLIDNNYNSPSATVTSIYQRSSKQFQVKNAKLSVKSVSNILASIASHMKSAEESVKQTKLNSASATLISLTILTLPFLPASNLFFYVGFVVAERILYLPSVGYCLLIGLGLGKLINFKVQCKSNGMKSRRKMETLRQHNTRSMATILFLIILISACSLKTIRRNRDWRDEESLYRSAIKVNPSKGNFSPTKLCLMTVFILRSPLAIRQWRQRRRRKAELHIKAIYLSWKILFIVELLISEICSVALLLRLVYFSVPDGMKSVYHDIHKL